MRSARSVKKQVIFIHGGETFETYNDYLEYLRSCEFDPYKERGEMWKDNLGEKLGNDFEVITPQMPGQKNAKYLEWKIWFEKVIPYIEDNVVIIGHSLGGIFVAKYLSENDLPKKILATYLIAPPYDDKDSEYSLADFVLPDILERFEKQSGKIFIYQSQDDTLVTFVNAEKYAKVLPKAEKVVFKDRGHFLQEEFPELIESIKNL